MRLQLLSKGLSNEILQGLSAVILVLKRVYVLTIVQVSTLEFLVLVDLFDQVALVSPTVEQITKPYKSHSLE